MFNHTLFFLRKRHLYRYALPGTILRCTIAGRRRGCMVHWCQVVGGPCTAPGLL